MSCKHHYAYWLSLFAGHFWDEYTLSLVFNYGMVQCLPNIPFPLFERECSSQHQATCGEDIRWQQKYL